MLSPDPDAVLDHVRRLCLALPEATEKVSHGMPTFMVAGKMFAHFRHNHHGDGRTVVCVKTTGRDEQELLLEADPDTYSRPAYLYPAGWIGVALAEPEWDLVEARLRTSWRLAAPRRLTAAPG